MASGVVRSSLECSCSGRGNYQAVASLRHANSRAVSPTAPAPVTRILSAPRRSTPDSFQQPPRGRGPALQRLRPSQVAQEVEPQSEKRKEPNVGAIEALNREWGIPGSIEFHVGQGGLPNVLITHPQTGMQMVVYLYGATIAQWLKHDGTVTFHDGPDELYQYGAPLRTGVSLHFPQHRDGPLPEHGFADSMMWEVAGAGFDTPEIIDSIEEHWTVLQQAGVITPELLSKWDEGDAEATATLEKIMQDNPPDLHITGDMSPFITLRLRDTPETRKIWPHRFQLDYKITLEVIDQISEEEDKEIRALAGEDPFAEEEEEEEGEGEEGAEGLAVEEGEEEALEEGEEGVEAPAARAQQAPKRRGRPRKSPVPAAEEEEEEAPREEEEEDGGAAAEVEEEDDDAEGPSAAAFAMDDEDDDDDGEEEDDPEKAQGAVSPEPWSPPTQIKQQFILTNKDKPGSPPMEFHLGSLARFRTMQQPEMSDWIKALGLGGAQTFDYTWDLRNPTMDLNLEDYLHYNGDRVDVTYVGAAEATVYLCPGSRTHFEFIQRAGFRDMFVEQPGLDVAPEFERVATMGTGYVASTKKLEPGDEWVAESVIRFHPRYWRPPIFGDDTMAPLPPISPEDLATEGDGDEGEEDAYDGIPSDTSSMMPDGGEE